MKNMGVIDADGHVEEHELTFSDKSLDPAFRAHRPQVVGVDGLAYWMIEEHLFPRRLGRGCHNLGTPTSYGGKRTLFSQPKPESLESLELRDQAARLRDMDASAMPTATGCPRPRAGVAQEELTLAVHVGWACPPLSNLYADFYTATVIPFLAPVLMGFASLLGGGILDRFPTLRVAFLEAGCEWVHFMMHRLEHRFHFAEVDDTLLPEVIELVGEDHIIFGSDMPHGDRERFAARTLLARPDRSEAAKRKILEDNPRRLYRL
jgi:hypothetical protein